MMIEMLVDEGKLSAGAVLAMPSEKAAELIESGVARAAEDQTEPKPKAAVAKPKKAAAAKAKSTRVKTKRAGKEVEEAVRGKAPEER